MSVRVDGEAALVSGGSSRVGGGCLQVRRNRLRLGLVLLASLVGLLSVGVGPANAATYNCTSGYFTVNASNVVTGNTSCAGTADIPSGVTSIGALAFWDATGLTSVSLPASVISIGNNAFGLSTSLTSITIPASVETIGESVFYNATSLVNIAVDGANLNYKATDGVLLNKTGTTLLEYPIGNTRTSYTTPSGLTSIGTRAFNSAPYLTNVTIGGGVTTIGVNAFYGATSLMRVNFEGVAAPPTVGISAFGRPPATGATAYRFVGSTGFTTSGSPAKWNGLLVADYVAAPPAPVAVAGVESATITVAAPSVGPTPTSYLVTASPGVATCTVTGASGSCLITGLTAATTYTFTAVAKTASPDLTSRASAVSNVVAPTARAVNPETPREITKDSILATLPTSLVSSTVASKQTSTGLEFRFTVNQLGTIWLQLKSTSTRSTHRATQVICTTTKRITKAGKITLKCPYTKAARQLLAKGALAVTSTTTFTPTVGTATTTTSALTLKRLRIATPRPIAKPTAPSSVTG